MLFGCLPALCFAVASAAPPDSLASASFELHKHAIFVKASLGGSPPLEMLLDSGSARTTLDEDVARKLGFDLSMKAQSTGARGLQEISAIKDQTLRLAGLEVTEPVTVVYSLDFLSKALGHRLDGIVGVEMFRKYVMEIDYAARQLRVFAPESYSYAGGGEVVAVTCDRRLPLVAGTVTPFGRPPVQTRFQIDTGAVGTNVALWKRFADDHDLMSGARDLKETDSFGFGGAMPAKEGTIERIDIGHLAVDAPQVRFVQMGDGSVFGGNLGSSFLERFKVVFDLPHDRMIFERAAQP